MARVRMRGRLRSRAAVTLLLLLPWVAVQSATAPLAQATGSGLQVKFFNYSSTEVDGSGNPIPARVESGSGLTRTPCLTANISVFDITSPASLPPGTCSSDNLIAHATGYLTIPGKYDATTINMQFRNQSKDGMFVTLTDPTVPVGAPGRTITVLSNWTDRNPTTYGPADFSNSDLPVPLLKGISYDIDMWYFHGTSASFLLRWFWLDPTAASPQYDIVPATALTLPTEPRPRADQLPLTVSATPAGIPLPSQPSATATLTPSGGSGLGAITFAAAAAPGGGFGPCTVNSVTGLVTPSASGVCYVTATKADDGVFAALTSDPLRVNVLYPQTAVQFASSVLSTMPYQSSQTLAINPATGSGTGAVSYQLVSGDCTLEADLLTVTNVNNNCVVTATKAADSDYDFSTSAPFTINVVAAEQQPMTVTSSSYRFNYLPGPSPATATLTRTAGGSGDGALSYQVAGSSLTVCSVAKTGTDTATVSALNRGDCNISVTKAADSAGLFNASTLTLLTIVIDPIAQTTPLSVVASPPLITYNPDPANLATTVVTVSGGDSTGSFGLTTASTSVCVLTPLTDNGTSATWRLTAGGPGDCVVQPSRAADNNYVVFTPAPVTIPVADIVRTSLTAAGTSGLSYTYGQTIAPVVPVTATGGVNTTFAAVLADGRTLDAAGSVLGLIFDAATGQLSGTLTGTSAPTTLTVTATDINGSTSSSSVTLTVAKAVPTLTWLSRPLPSVYYGTGVSDVLVAATGGTGPGVVAPSGAITYAPLPGSDVVCAIGSGSGIVAVLRAGQCQFGATIAEDANYLSAGLQASFVIAPMPPTPPQNVRVAVTDDKIVVSWDPPADDGGTAIASFTARALSGGVTSACSVGGATYSCSILSVTSGSRYSVTASATNSDILSFNGLASLESAPTAVTVPYATVRFATGTIANRYDPTPVTAALDSLSSGDQQDLLDAGIVQAPSNAPTVIVTANMSDANYSTPIDITVPQTVDSGSEVRLRVVPPSDTPVGSVMTATMLLPTGRSVALGNTVLTTSLITSGVTLASFAIVTPGNYTLTVRIADPVAAAAFAKQVRTAVGAVHQTVTYAIRVVAGAAGVPQIAAAPVADPSPSVEPSPTLEPTPTETATQEPEPQPSASVDDRGLVVVDPLDAPVEVAKTAVAAVALVSAVSAAASAAAAVGSAASAGSAAASSGGTAGGARAGGGATSGGSGGGSGGGSAGGDRNDSSDNAAQIQTVDVDHESFEDLTENWGDALPIWGYPALKVLDRRTHNATVRLAPISPLLSKLLTDGAYTRAIVGVFSVILPLAGIVIAAFAAAANGNLLLPPPTTMLIAMAVIGVLDAAAGALTMGVFVAIMSVQAGLHNAADVRLMLGLMIIGFGPALLAGAFRGIRRNAAAEPAHWWERVVDLGVAPFIGGWATKGMVEALPGLSGVQLPVAADSAAIGMAVAIALAVRVVAEEFTAQYFPGRLNVIHPTQVPPPPLVQKALALAVRAAVFFFVAEAFIGRSWYLWVGTILFILPNYVGLFADRFPNFPVLHHVLPAGLPGMAFTLLIASVGLAELTHIVGETPELAKIAFAVLPIPSAFFQILAMFGREPRPGDVRWYQRDSFKWVYWIGGPLVLVYTMHLAGII